MLELFRGSGMRRSLFAAAVMAWLLNDDWFRIIPNRWVESPMAYASFCGFLAFRRSQCAPATSRIAELPFSPAISPLLANGRWPKERC